MTPGLRRGCTVATEFYKKPKIRLHREFLYLNHDAVINSLSALEAGKVDEIIEKSMEGGEGGLEGGIGVGPAKVSANKKKQSSIQAELTRKRTKFSAFQAWYEYLHDQEAVGVVRGWNESVRSQLLVGDTIEFECALRLAPVGLLIAAYVSYVEEASKQGSPLQIQGKELAAAKQQAKLMQSWMTGSWPVYCAPHGVEAPRVVARLEEDYFIADLDRAEGDYTVVGQVDALLEGDDRTSVIRVMTGSPVTRIEMDTSVEALANFVEPAKALGVELQDDDFVHRPPTVIIRPLAIYR